MIEKIADIFFPRVCLVCGKVLKEGKRICDECSTNIKIITEPKCIKCGRALCSDENIYCEDCVDKKHFFEQGISLFEYSGEFQKVMYRFKYDNAREYADYYGMKTAEIYGNTFTEWGIDVIIPVPMYIKKKVARGYNQAEVFAKKVAQYTKIPLDTKSLIRRKSTLPQKELADEMRRLNLSNAFALDTSQIAEYKKVLLVDDIYTTGSTIDACAKLLRRAGVEKVYFLCISTKRAGTTERNSNAYA